MCLATYQVAISRTTRRMYMIARNSLFAVWLVNEWNYGSRTRRRLAWLWGEGGYRRSTCCRGRGSL